MKYAVLDTNFILSCIRKKIDFFHEIKFMGIKILIPGEVIQELRNLQEEGNKNVQNEAKIALLMLSKNSFEKIFLNTKNVDNGIVKMAKENKEYIVGTLDKEIKSKIKNAQFIIRGEKNLEIR
jgi:rRNA-processing protein FCF1